jgi:hypothetical protein
MCIYISIYIKKKFPLVVPTLVNTMLYLNYYKIHILNLHINLSFILEWQKHFQIVGHTSYNLNVNEDFVMFFTTKLMTCFIDSFTSGLKSQSLVYLLIESAHTHQILDLEDEVHSIRDLWTSNLQECKGNVFFKIEQSGQQFSIGLKNISKKNLGAAPARIYLPLHFHKGYFNVRNKRWGHCVKSWGESNSLVDCQLQSDTAIL